MRKAAAILSSITFIVLLLQTLSSLLIAGISVSLVLFANPDNPGSKQTGLVLTIVFSILAVLSLIGFILVILGRASVLNESKRGPTLLIVAGAISICPLAVVAGILYRKGKIPESEENR